MKRFFSFFLSALLLCSFGVPVCGQISEQSLSFNYAIIASKNGSERIYKPGTRFFIKHSIDHSTQKVRGYFAGVAEGKIAILSKKRAKETMLICADSILLLRKIRPGSRILFSSIGAALIGGGAAILDNASGANSGAGVLVIPVIGAGVYFLCAVPISLMIEKVNEKTIAKEWKFEIRKFID